MRKAYFYRFLQTLSYPISSLKGSMILKKILELDALWSQRVRMDPVNHRWFRIPAFLAHSGDSWFWLAGLGIVWLLTTGEWHTRSALLAIGVVGLAVVVLTIKFTIRRQRPPGEWGAIYRNTDPHSFPSGHAARAALLAVLAIGLGPVWFGWLVAIWAPFVSLARVVTGVHYLSDILAGILFGMLAGGFMLMIAPLLIAFFPFLF
jgi:undecaprenyl-diphosphatase